MSTNVKTAVFWVVIICAVVLVYMAVKTTHGANSPESLSAYQFVQAVEDNKIEKVEVTGGTDVTGTMKKDGTSGKSFHTTIPVNYPEIYKAMQEKHVDYSTKESTEAAGSDFCLTQCRC